MDVQAKKLRLIEWLINIQDVGLLNQLWEVQEKSKNERDVIGYHPDGSPITAEELIARAEASNRDIEAGRVHDLEEVLEEMERRLGA